MEKRRYYEDNPAANVPNTYDLPVWTHPKDYGGHSPVGDYLIYSRNRDSPTLDNVNYDGILESLEQAYEQSGDDCEDNQPYDFRVNHWGVGWVEYIIIPRSAPNAVLKAAYDILGALADYPVLDDEKLSQAEYDDASESWDNWARRDVESKIETEYSFGYVGTGENEIELELSDAGPIVELFTDRRFPEYETHNDGPHFDTDEIAQQVVDSVDENPYSLITQFEDWFTWQVALTS